MAQIRNRGCSRKLQRAVCGLAADNSFGQASKKLQEHYGIELCSETIRKITERQLKIRRSNS